MFLAPNKDYRVERNFGDLGVKYYVAAPNVTVTFGTEPDALTQSQTMVRKTLKIEN